MPSTKPVNDGNTPKNIATCIHTIEALRSRLVDLDALANAAEQLLGELPFLDTLDESARRNYGRLHSLTNATAETARSILDECEESLARLYGPDDGDEPGSGSQGSGNEGAGGLAMAHSTGDNSKPRSNATPSRVSKGGILLDRANPPASS